MDRIQELTSLLMLAKKMRQLEALSTKWTEERRDKVFYQSRKWKQLD
jgi:hypothetical protein